MRTPRPWCLALLAFCCSCWIAQAEAVSLFDGKTLAGWEGDLTWWKVVDGEIRGGSFEQTVPKNQFLATEKSYQNFDLRLKLRLTGTGFVNSGVQFRSIRVPNSSEMSGFQADYGKGYFGQLYDESRRNKKMADPLNPTALLAAVEETGWNEYRIRCEGRHIQTWMNGVPALDYTEADTQLATDGKIGIQIHSGGKAVVQAKDIFIEELPATPNEMTWAKVAARPKAKAAAVAPAAQDYNNVSGSRRSAEEEQKMFHLPAGFEIELFAKESVDYGKFIMLVFDQHGRAWSSTAFEYPVDANEMPAAADALYQSKARDKVIVFDQPFTSGLHQPRTFADGLAIPEGVLPYKDGAIVQHGHDIVFLRDTQGTGKADRREVLLSGFGVQDSHLFPHQFTRAPGGWFWLAQGAFNTGKVKTTTGELVDFPSTRMARFRPDGSFLEPTSVGPCNIWGLVLTGEGECFIQEANDYGYPVMPFQEYAWYPGCADRLAKTYQPPFPVQAPDFRMGGTGLSGLALSDAGIWPAGFDQVMYVANPITSKINAIKMQRSGPGYHLDKLADFLSCDDPFFRPIALNFGPDGCLYMVDWYNKIISHNEVARNHPDRDKFSGRIWRIKPKGFTPAVVPDYTQLSSADLLARLGGTNTANAHLAWQTLSDRDPEAAVTKALRAIVEDTKASDARRLQALWVLGWQKQSALEHVPTLLQSANRNVRREAVSVIRQEKAALAQLEVLRRCQQDADPEVRTAAIKTLGEALDQGDSLISALLEFAQPSLAGPMAPGHNGKPIRVGVAYDCEFERFLVRMFLERKTELTAKFLATPAAQTLSLEAQMLACLALEPKTGAPLIAGLLPKLNRVPADEEILRIAQFPGNSECATSLQNLLARPETRAPVAERLASFRTKLETDKVGPLLVEATRALLAGTPEDRKLAVTLIGGFQMPALERDLMGLVTKPQASEEQVLLALQALQEMRSSQIAYLPALVKNGSKEVSLQATATLVASRAPEAPAQALELYPALSLAHHRIILNSLSSTKVGAKALAAAVLSHQVSKNDIDGPTAEKMAHTLGDGAELKALMAELAQVFRPVLSLHGKNSVAETNLDLQGPFTLEFWVRLAPGIGNNDGVLGAANQLDINFADARLRLYAFPPLGDVIIAKNPITPEVWTHYAITRDARGELRLYGNGELESVGRTLVTRDFKGCNVGWTVPKKGTFGALAEYRVWNVARTASEIRNNFTRSYAGEKRPAEMTFYNAGGDSSWGKLQAGASVVQTTDVPPLLSAEQFKVFEEKNAHYMALGRQGGDVTKGRAVAAICMVCHMINGQGGQIGPNLSGAGAMGLEGVVRNIMDPNAAMEAAYRTFRLELKSGDLIDAFYVSEDAQAYVIRQPASADRRVLKSEVQSARYIRRSLMPEGLLEGLTDEQVRDLLAYLMTLK